MGYSEDRGDQVTVETFPFSGVEELVATADSLSPREIWENYGRFITNILLIFLLVLLVVRPIVKTVKDVKGTIDKDTALAIEDEKRLMIEEEKKKVPEVVIAVTPAERAKLLAREDVMKTANIIKGWLSEDY